MKNGPYDDMIDLPHHVSATRPQMPMANRAAIFAPFAALTGYEAAIKETARLTDERIELDESAITAINMKLSILTDRIAEHPEVIVTFFKPDAKKEGGSYYTLTGAVKKIDDYEGVIVFQSDERIAIVDILDIESELFRDLI